MKKALEYRRLGSIGKLSGLSNLEIELHFALSEEEVSAVLRKRGSANRLGLALQLGLLKATGCHPSRSLRIQPEVLRHVAGQIGLPAPDVADLRSFYPRLKTYYQHRKEAEHLCGFREMTEGVRRALMAHLNQVCAQATDHSAFVRFAREWLRLHKYVSPAKRDLNKQCLEAWHRRLALLDLSIRASVSTDQWVETLRQRTSTAVSTFDWLREGPRKKSSSALAGELDKVGVLRELGAAIIDLDGTPEAVIAAHARRVTSRKLAEIARWHDPKRTVSLACYFNWELRRRLDLAVDQLIFLVNGIQRKAQQEASRNLSRHAPSLAQKHVALLDRLDVLCRDQTLSEEQLRSEVQTLVASHRDSKRPAISMAQATRNEMAQGGLPLKRLSDLAMRLGAEVSEDHPLGTGLKVIASVSKAGGSSLPDNTTNPFGSLRSDLIDGKERDLALSAWRAATVLLLKKSLKNGSAYIPDSGNWRAPDSHLIPLRLWQRDSRKFTRSLGVEQTGGAFIRKFEPMLQASLSTLATAVQNGEISIQGDRFRVPRISRKQEEPGVRSTREALMACVGTAQFPDVIMDVDRTLGMSRILMGRDIRSPREQLQLYAALFALGSDLDISQTARMIKGVSIDGVGQTMRLLENGDRIQEANAALVKGIHDLSITSHWGDGVYASSDMMSLDAARGLWSARTDPRRRTRAVGTYTHVLDQWALAYDQPIILNERQAGAAIEGAIRQDNALLERVAVDTHGVTHVSMALSKMLGFDICPRFAGLADRKLYVFSDTHVPKSLTTVVNRSLSRRKISRGWEGLCRLAASTKGGWCSAVWATQRNGAASTGEAVYQAADHLGKMLRTIYLCDYLANAEFRSEIHKLLARGEAVHPLQRAIYDGALKPRSGRTFDQLRGVSAALTLLANTVISWNAMQFENAFKDPTFAHPPEHMAHIAPIRFQHITLRGIFTFDLSQLSQNSHRAPSQQEKIA